MPKKTKTEFKNAGQAKNIKRWDIETCPQCGAPQGFRIQGNTVTFNSDCEHMEEQDSDFAYLAEYYEEQSAPVKSEFDIFWGFSG